MHRSQQRTSARYRIPIVVWSLAVAVGTASAQHDAPPIDRSAGPRTQKVYVDRSDRHVDRNLRGPVVMARPPAYAGVPYRDGGYPYDPFYPYYYYPYYAYAWGQTSRPYLPANGGYTVVEVPVGATVTSVPPEAQAVVVNGMAGYYYYGGTYYQQSPSGFVVVAPIPGMIVENLPRGGREVRIGARAYVQVGTTYYQPHQRNGKDVWQVVEAPQRQ